MLKYYDLVNNKSRSNNNNNSSDNVSETCCSSQPKIYIFFSFCFILNVLLSTYFFLHLSTYVLFLTLSPLIQISKSSHTVYYKEGEISIRIESLMTKVPDEIICSLSYSASFSTITTKKEGTIIIFLHYSVLYTLQLNLLQKCEVNWKKEIIKEIKEK